MLPLVDELILNIGEGDDDTWNLVQSMREPKIRPFRSWWDPNLRVGGELLARQTNLALERCQGDWGIYLQADEVLHEKDYPLIRRAMERHRSDSTEAIRFRYHHFYGSFQTIQDYPRIWYTRGIRIVKLGIGASSWGDAMDFCLRRDGREWFLRYADIDAYIYHYGWSRPPEIMRTKRANFERLYRDDAAVAAMSLETRAMYRDLGNLRYFRGTHPEVMRRSRGRPELAVQSRDRAAAASGLVSPRARVDRSLCAPRAAVCRKGWPASLASRQIPISCSMRHCRITISGDS